MLASILLFSIGILGATDMSFYHSVAHGIRQHQDSKLELYIHSLRGLTYTALFIIVPNFECHGIYFWGLIAILFIDLLISIADFAIERKSREGLGGLPSGEYVLHILIAMLFGAFVTTIFLNSYHWHARPDALNFTEEIAPRSLRLLMAIMAVVVFISGIQDLLAAFKLKKSAPE
jgi:phosphatidylglycerophosphate synthase